MDSAVSITLIALAAFALPLVGTRVRVPAVVLEILFGILVGPAVLGWIHPTEVEGALAELGFFLLMFLSGFEIDFGKLERHGTRWIVAGLAVFGLTLLMAYACSRALGYGPFVTLVLATTSVGLVIPTLRERGRASTPLGQMIIICALLADFLTLVLAALYAMAHERGLGWHLLDFPALFVAIVGVLLGLRRLAWWFPEKFERLFARDDPEELGIRASLALMFTFVGLSYALGVEPILGAFLAGAVFSLVFRHRGWLEQKLNGFAFGFFIPIFFIHVGLQFDLQSLQEAHVLQAALALLAAAFVVKLLAVAPLALLGFRPVDLLSAGILLSARLSLVIAVATVGVRLGLVDPALQAEVVLLAMVTSTLCPTLFSMARGRTPPRASRLSAGNPRRRRRLHSPPDQKYQTSPGRISHGRALRRSFSQDSAISRNRFSHAGQRSGGP